MDSDFDYLEKMYGPHNDMYVPGLTRAGIPAAGRLEDYIYLKAAEQGITNHWKKLAEYNVSSDNPLSKIEKWFVEQKYVFAKGGEVQGFWEWFHSQGQNGKEETDSPSE